MPADCEDSGSGDKLCHYKILASIETLLTFLVLPISEDYIQVDMRNFFLFFDLIKTFFEDYFVGKLVV